MDCPAVDDCEQVARYTLGHLLLAQVVDEQETSIEQHLQDLEQLHGAQVAVVALATLEGQVIEEVALQIAQTWGVGNAEVDNGVVVLIAPNERQRRIEIGYGLE